MKKLAAAVIAAALFTLTATAGVPPTLRINELGYRPADSKVAVYMGDTDPAMLQFTIVTPDGSLAPDSIVVCPAWQPARYSARIYMSSAAKPGQYSIDIADNGKLIAHKPFTVDNDVYSRYARLPLNYLRQQRCGYNPVHNAHCHRHDGYVVLSDNIDGSHYDVTGGWHDASDYLQYLTTSANTVYMLLEAYRANPSLWEDCHNDQGLPGPNGIPDILDEARWGLEWMMKMNPNDSLYFNQIADDRDHRFVGAPQNDTTDYGYGPGSGRPVYPCLGHPCGLQRYANRSRGKASSVAKFASAFGRGYEVFATLDSTWADELKRRAAVAYNYACLNPGECQTAPCSSPYFYEEDNWVDDMELAAAVTAELSDDNAGARRLITEAMAWERREPVTPWMGADTARHYQWYPFVNLGHVELARSPRATPRERAETLRNMRSGVERVARRGADNAFRNGIPFVWCSNNLTCSYVTQAMLYRMISGDGSYREAEAAMRDWLFGCNPWGQVMMLMPDDSGIASPRDPHSAMTDMVVGGKPGREYLVGALVDGPVYTSIFNSLWGVHLRGEDRLAGYQGPTCVYHDDFSDYSTNEPTLDGTASLALLLSLLSVDN